ncbi:hypothetical protein B0H15DRAFT_99818 [Mycena belliarum]|uniref:Uncharacterized protein n=1 Tax=Mycena belliarum TaxID=1033014 RepID=A0AAD6UC90_9AGAR|nr:hypothetical protein B0H15DRAFT_99818 [Mycena belliae]
MRYDMRQTHFQGPGLRVRRAELCGEGHRDARYRMGLGRARGVRVTGTDTSKGVGRGGLRHGRAVRVRRRAAMLRRVRVARVVRLRRRRAVVPRRLRVVLRRPAVVRAVVGHGPASARARAAARRAEARVARVPLLRARATRCARRLHWSSNPEERWWAAQRQRQRTKAVQRWAVPKPKTNCGAINASHAPSRGGLTREARWTWRRRGGWTRTYCKQTRIVRWMGAATRAC